MSARHLLIVAALVLWGCGSGDSSPEIELTSINGNGVYSACLPGTSDVALGGIIVALTADGSAPELDEAGVADPETDVVIERVELESPPGSIDTEANTPVLQVTGLESSFAVPVAADHRRIDPEAGDRVTARPDGALAPPDSFGWYSLIVPVRASGNEIDVRDVALTYRIADGPPVRGRLDMAWRLCLDDCGPTCPVPADEEPDAVDPAEWITVFDAGVGDAWEVATELPG